MIRRLLTRLGWVHPHWLVIVRADEVTHVLPRRFDNPVAAGAAAYMHYLTHGLDPAHPLRYEIRRVPTC